jgi:hypothetical protein
VLALWDLADRKKLADLVDRAVTELAEASRRQREIIRQESLRILTRTLDEGLFQDLRAAASHLSETPFSLKVDGNIIEGVIDHLLVFGDGSCEVIDYKTNRVDAGQLETLAEAYRFQVGVYALAVSQTVGPVRSGAVLFLSPARWVRWKLDEAVLADLKGELNRCIEGIQCGRFESRPGDCRRCGHAFLCPERETDDSPGVAALEV